MSRIVMKFGGTSVADIARIRNAARFVRRQVDDGKSVVVVVSAMAGETNKLVALAAEAGPRPLRSTCATSNMTRSSRAASRSRRD